MFCDENEILPRKPLLFSPRDGGRKGKGCLEDGGRKGKESQHLQRERLIIRRLLPKK